MPQPKNTITQINLTHAITQLLKSSWLLLASSMIFYYYSKDVLVVYAKYFPTINHFKTIPEITFFSFYSLLWLMILPITFNKLIRAETLKSIGITWPKNKTTAILSIIGALAFLLPFMIYFATDSSFQSYKIDHTSTPQFIIMMTLLFPIYYLGEECFMRGFLFLGLWHRIRWHSFWITDVMFTLFHLGKPIPEILLCIPASIIFNIITLLNRSILPAVIVHSTMGITLCTLVTFNLISVSG